MISMKTIAVAAAAMMAIGSGVALAKDANKVAVVHSPESIQCSKDADAKGLKGKERKKFRSHCMRDMKKHHEDKKS
jgi:hypothetical protein